MEHMIYSSGDILERVDEYTLYCSYLGYEPLIGAKYTSPMRRSTDTQTDCDPSFGIFERKYGNGPHEYMWKDQGIGLHGDIFDLVMIICKLSTRTEAKHQVLIDAGIMNGTSATRIVDPVNVRHLGYSSISIMSRPFSSRDLHYWDRIGVGKELLEWYKIKALRAYWLFDDQKAPRVPKGMAFSYEIFGKYQLYFPYEEKRRKFRTDWTEICVPGYLQLQYNAPLLVITKSMKDVVSLRSFGYEAIAPRGENILLPRECIWKMQQKYRRIVVLFDNDGKHKGDEYPFEKVYVPRLLKGDKDVTDFCCNHGKKETADMLRQIIQL
jgi:hypothetical protein